MNSPVILIAEAGVNHNGDLSRAEDLIRAAAQAGADFIKFQAFDPEYLVLPEAPAAPYQNANTGGENDQLAMLRRYALSPEQLRHLRQTAQENHIGFVCSVFDLPSLHALLDMGETRIKIPSGEIDHIPLLQAVGASGTEVWLSTGMASMNEIRTAIEVLLASGMPPGNLTLMHCHSQYPTRPEDANLTAIQTLMHTTGIPVGYSDHTEGIACAIAAVALGATLIEKHFTLDKSLPGPDHKASLNPEEFTALVKAIRETERALGDGIKKPGPEELINKPLVRKGIYASRKIQKGSLIQAEDLICLRPATRMPAGEWLLLVNTPAKQDFNPHEPITR